MYLTALVVGALQSRYGHTDYSGNGLRGWFVMGFFLQESRSTLSCVVWSWDACRTSSIWVCNTASVSVWLSEWSTEWAVVCEYELVIIGFLFSLSHRPFSCNLSCWSHRLLGFVTGENNQLTELVSSNTLCVKACCCKHYKNLICYHNVFTGTIVGVTSSSCCVKWPLMYIV